MTTSKGASQHNELEALRAEVSRLQSQLDAAHQPTAREHDRRGRTVARAISATVLLLVGILLAPITIAAAWATTELRDTDRFVASLAPLTQNPEVRSYLAGAIVTAIEKRVDIPALTDEALSGIASLGLPPRASRALESLSPAAAAGLENLLSTAVHNVVNSPKFQKAWTKALRLSHDQVDDILTNNQKAAITVSGTGSVGVQLAPLISKVKATLKSQDFPLADQIPVVNKTIPIGTVKEITPLRTAYQLLVLLVGILPWIAAVCLAAGIVVAPTRARAAMWAGVGLAICLGLALGVLGVERQTLANRASTHGVPPGVTLALLDSLLAQIWAAGLAVVLLGVVLAIAGFLGGASRAAVAIRSWESFAVASLQAFLGAHNLWSRRFGSALHSARYGVWIVIVAGALVVLYVSAPLTAGTVIWVAIIAAFVLLVFSLFQSSPGTGTDAGLGLSDGDG